MGNIPHGILNTLTDSPESLTRYANKQRDNRRYRKEYQGELPAQKQQVPHVSKDCESFPNDDSHGIGRCTRNLGDMESYLGNQMSHRMPVIKGTG